MNIENALLSHVIKSAIVIIIGVLIYKIIGHFAKRISKRTNILGKLESKKNITYKNLLTNLFKYIYLIIFILILLQVNGINVSAMLAGVGIVGVVIGLAIQDALKDIIRGTTLLTDDYFNVGDIIKIGDNTGEVIYMGLKTTKIKDCYTFNIISIANRNIEKVEIVSNNLDINVPMPYETKLEDAEDAMKEIVSEVKKIKTVTESTYKSIASLSESSIDYRLNIKCDNKKLLQTKRDTLRIIVVVLDKHKITIPYKQIDIHNKK